MIPAIAIDPFDERDRRLVDLLGGLSEVRRAGREPDVEAVARLHPDLAEELRELWAAATVADELARFPNLSGETGEWSSPNSGRSGSENGGRLFGNYELLEELGRGGMGVVHRARQLDLDRVVAVKRLLAR